MHTQAASIARGLLPSASRLRAARGVCLYLATLGIEGVLGAGARWFLTYLGAAALGALLPLGLAAAELALLAAFAPLAFSALGLLAPGAGLIWPRRLGARRPSAEETELIEQAHELLRSTDPELPSRPTVYLVDEPLPWAAARGRAVLISRGLLDTDALAPVLAHELGHTRTLDGRITEALARLRLRPERPRPSLPSEDEPRRREGELLTRLTRAFGRVAIGGSAERLLAPLWAAHWRECEHAADAYAASLGQGHDLARHLAEYELALDLPQRRFPLNLSEHPPVALRIERLNEAPLGT